MADATRPAPFWNYPSVALLTAGAVASNGARAGDYAIISTVGAETGIYQASGAGPTFTWTKVTVASWSDVLAIGNASGGLGNDPVISSGDVLRAPDINGAGAPATLTLRGGNNASVFSTADGGPITITGGSTLGNAAPAKGGDVTVQGGPSTGTAASGGSMFVKGGTSLTGTGGSVTVQAADGTTAGHVSILAGNGHVAQGQGGNVSVKSGTSSGSPVNAGFIELVAADSLSNNGNGGLIQIKAGGGERSGGPILIKAGTKNATDGTTANSTGAILIETGDYTGGAGVVRIGGITIRCVSAASSTQTVTEVGNVLIEASNAGRNNSISGGGVTLNAGDSNGFGGAAFGGDIDINAGNQIAADGDRGGDVNLTGGNVTSGSKRAGNVIITPGTGGTGGQIVLAGAVAHTGTLYGFFGATPVAQTAAYTVTNVTPDRSYDANATTVAELADVLGTLIADLQAFGLAA